MPESLSYIIAGYNEESIIENSIRECHSTLSEDFPDFEIILVDDASTDNTRAIMENLAKEFSNIKVICNLVNLNFGTSVLRGIKAASKDIIIYNAADLPLSPKDTKAITKQMREYDLLVLERKQYHATGWRKLTSSVNILLLRLFYPRLTKGTPVLNFVQMFRKEIVDQILPLARSPIFVWPEMIFRAKLNSSIKVGNMPVDLNIGVTRKGAFGKPHDIIWGIYDMLRFRIRSWNKKL
jgi:undecaprenyl-phosphate 4-deoxy-4-formamido-L-arabinose transferase